MQRARLIPAVIALVTKLRDMNTELTKQTANILTIVATCVSHGLNPREYLLVATDALLAGAEDIDALLPDRIVAAHPELVVPGFDEPELRD